MPEYKKKAERKLTITEVESDMLALTTYGGACTRSNGRMCTSGYCKAICAGGMIIRGQYSGQSPPNRPDITKCHFSKD